MSPIAPWDPGPGLCLLPEAAALGGSLEMVAPAHWPTCVPLPPPVSRRLFLTSKCCHLPPRWGSLRASLPAPGQGSPSLSARPRLLLLASCLPSLPFGPPEGNAAHLFQPGPKRESPALLPQITPASPPNVCSSEEPSGNRQPLSLLRPAHVHCVCIMHCVYACGKDSVPPLPALLPPQPWCVGSLAKQRLLFVRGDLTQGEWAALALEALFSSGTLSSEGPARPPVPALPAQWAPERGWTPADPMLRLSGAPAGAPRVGSP